MSAADPSLESVAASPTKGRAPVCKPPVEVRVIGVDPGSRITGYGIIQVSGTRSICIAHGRIRCGAGELAGRLLIIQRELTALVREHQPQEAAVEQVFVHRNVSSALVLGHARGAALSALADAGLRVAEYAPARIKSAIVGNGRAEKVQVQLMIRHLLKLEQAPQADAADALAAALCHAQWRTAPAALRAPVRARSSWRSFKP